MAWGAEATWRDLDVPVVLVTEDGKEEAGGIEQDEEHHRLYLYLAAGEQVALSAELAYDRFREPSASADAFRPVPAEVTTTSVPLGVSYFRPNGLFASLRVTYVEQRVERAADAVFAQDKDSFSLVDVAVGYRFAQRRGIASLGVKNLTDEEFEFLDDSFREFSEDATTGPYAPEQMVLGRITLSF